MRLTLVSSIALSLAVACGSGSASTVGPAYSAADDEAVLRDPVLEAEANSNAMRRPRQGVPPNSREDASATTDSAPPAGRSRQSVGIRGITGSLTAFEVDEAMNTRADALMMCVQQRPNRLGYVAGDIKFHMDVDARGKADRVRITQSNIGLPSLEACLVNVVASAPFPVPAGQQRAEAAWQMSVDPLGREAEPIDSAELEDAITRQSAASYEACGIDHDRRFAVTAYINRGGVFGTVSLRSPWRGSERTRDDSDEEIKCLTQSLTSWTYLPKPGHITKAVFELRWVVAPEEPRGRGRQRGNRNATHKKPRHKRRG